MADIRMHFFEDNELKTSCTEDTAFGPRIDIEITDDVHSLMVSLPAKAIRFLSQNEELRKFIKENSIEEIKKEST